MNAIASHSLSTEVLPQESRAVSFWVKAEGEQGLEGGLYYPKIMNQTENLSTQAPFQGEQGENFRQIFGILTLFIEP